MESDEALDRTIEVMHQELVAAMFLTGSAKWQIAEKAPVFITGRTRQMIGKDNPARIKR